MTNEIEDELIDNLLKGYKKPEDLIGENGLLKQLTKRLLERAMAAELTEHVGYEKHDLAGQNSGNSRNGKSAKTVKGTFGTVPIEVPRDRNGTFEPQIVGSTRRGSRVLTRILYRCTRGGFRHVRYSSTLRRSIRSRCRRG